MGLRTRRHSHQCSLLFDHRYSSMTVAGRTDLLNDQSCQTTQAVTNLCTCAAVRALTSGPGTHSAALAGPALQKSGQHRLVRTHLHRAAPAATLHRSHGTV